MMEAGWGWAVNAEGWQIPRIAWVMNWQDVVAAKSPRGEEPRGEVGRGWEASPSSQPLRCQPFNQQVSQLPQSELCLE